MVESIERGLRVALAGVVAAAGVAVAAPAEAGKCWLIGCHGWRTLGWLGVWTAIEDDGWGDPWYDDGHFGLAEAALASVAIGTVVRVERRQQRMPAADCPRVRVDGRIYRNCGGAWYQRVGQGSWVAVADPT